MTLTIPIQFDEDKMREIVAEAVLKLHNEGFIWRDKPQPFDWEAWKNELLGQQNSCSSGQNQSEEH